MPNKDKLGDFYTSNNELGINSTMSFGNSSVNVSINSTSVVISPSTSLSANGTIGSSGQVLTSNGTTVYWAAAAAGVNTAAQYTWTNTHLFNANVTVNASFFATTKSFLIDHPTKPDMKLRYGSLEGPENGVYVRGISESFIIELPDYWTGLVHADSITVSLTAIGRPQNLYVDKIENNVVYVDTDDYTSPHFYYHIFAERKDVDILIVEY